MEHLGLAFTTGWRPGSGGAASIQPLEVKQKRTPRDCLSCKSATLGKLARNWMIMRVLSVEEHLSAAFVAFMMFGQLTTNNNL